MNRTAAITLLMAAAGTVVAAPAVAQAGPQPFPQQCTWEECALRIQAPKLTTGMKVVRGRESIEVVPLGLLQPAIAPFVQLSDSAVAWARVYDDLYDRGSIVSLAGTAISIIAPIVMRGTMQKIAFTGAGIGLTVVGGVITNRADDALSRAIWHYNRELPR
jgi:hypothetical protein